MTINKDEFSNQDLSYKIDMVSGKGGPLIDRTIGLKSGEKISFTVKLAGRAGMSLRDMHVESIQRAIELLTSYLEITTNPTLEPTSRPHSLSDRLP